MTENEAIKKAESLAHMDSVHEIARLLQAEAERDELKHKFEHQRSLVQQAHSEFHRCFPLLNHGPENEFDIAAQIRLIQADIQTVIAAAETIEAAGRPHAGINNPAFPDGCECEQCEAWDQLKKALSDHAPSELTKLQSENAALIAVAIIAESLAWLRSVKTEPTATVEALREALDALPKGLLEAERREA